MTFSIIGFDPSTNEIGIAVQSKFPNVASIVSHATADVGAVTTQASGDPAIGRRGLELLSLGVKPKDVVRLLLQADPLKEERQIAVMDKKGQFANFTGSKASDFAAGFEGDNCFAHGNFLSNREILPRMILTFHKTKGTLADKLLDALKAAQVAGGEKRGQQSAGLLVVKKNGGYCGGGDRYIDISIYDHLTPIEELERCYEIHKKVFLK